MIQDVDGEPISDWLVGRKVVPKNKKLKILFSNVISLGG